MRQLIFAFPHAKIIKILSCNYKNRNINTINTSHKKAFRPVARATCNNSSAQMCINTFCRDNPRNGTCATAAIRHSRAKMLLLDAIYR